MQIPENRLNILSLLGNLNPQSVRYMMSPAQMRCIIKGNQGGGTAVSTGDAVARFLRIHPVEKRNVLNDVVRFVSKVVPKGPDDAENQQYVEFKRRFPPELIKRDVTARSNIMIVRDPHGGSDNKAEFMASTQDHEAFMSVQRAAYYQDEEISKTKFDENMVRLLQHNGDVTISLTPAIGLDWTYDAIWKKASKIYRSKTICDKLGLPAIETFDGDDIECFCWATDDNPVMNEKTINRVFSGMEDPEDSAEYIMRRYGVFRQVSGRIFKAFDKQLHVIKAEEYYDASMLKAFWHYRVIDYHQKKPWYVTWVVVSPTHEWFVWNELKASHDLKTTYDLRDDIKDESLLHEDNEFNRATIIDPLACIKQTNTGFTVFDDISRGEYGLRRCVTADTKNSQGRMNIKMRLKNAVECGKPGNNYKKTGEPDLRYGLYMPTIWIMDNCKGHIEHLNSWRYIDFKQEHVKATKTVKRESEKYSDYCRNLEFLGALNPVFYQRVRSNQEPRAWFQGRRVA